MEPGRHSAADRVVVRLITGAVDDLERVLRKGDPQVVRWALKKMLLLERDPEAGEPLLGNLVGWRKLTVGNRDWRIVWRVGHDADGAIIVDVAEVWAFGARSDAEVYGEVERRIAERRRSPVAVALADVLSSLGKVSRGLAAAPEVVAADQKPDWLVDVLTKVVGLAPEAVAGMTADEAHEAWTAYTTGPGA